MSGSKTNSPRKQKQLGPAPIASFEDTSSDELKFKVNVLEVDEMKMKKEHTLTHLHTCKYIAKLAQQINTNIMPKIQSILLKLWQFVFMRICTVLYSETCAQIKNYSQ